MVVDAGPLYAYVDRDDRHHRECLTLLTEHPGPLIVPVLVVTEVAYFLETRLGAGVAVRFLGDIASRASILEHVADQDWLRIAGLVWQYRDMELGTVDASVIAVAERLDVRQLATLDRRHFAAVQPKHAPAFDLLP